MFDAGLLQSPIWQHKGSTISFWKNANWVSLPEESSAVYGTLTSSAYDSPKMLSCAQLPYSTIPSASSLPVTTLADCSSLILILPSLGRCRYRSGTYVYFHDAHQPDLDRWNYPLPRAG